MCTENKMVYNYLRKPYSKCAYRARYSHATDTDKSLIRVIALLPLFTFAARRIAWTALCWTRSRFPNRPLTSRASWKSTGGACSIRRIPQTPMSRRKSPWRSIIARDYTSISSVASTPWEVNAGNFCSPTVVMATMRPRRADIPAITTR